ncbi:MAG: FliH/SctL family protein [Peptococcaceae bacterium]|nr:FliH/SctL family protein [Peptococcaceae bacterium]
MKSSSKEQIIKRQDVTINNNPRRLVANKILPESSGEAGATSSIEISSNAGGELSQGEGSFLAAVREQAQIILQDARAQGEAIIREARLQEERLRREIFDAVMAEALPQALEEAIPLALEEGRERGRQEGLQEVTEAAGKVRDFYDMLERAWHDELARIDEDLLDLAIKISERLVGTALKYDKDKILSMIRSLILLPNERRNLKIVVSDEDWEWLNNLQDKGLPPYPLIRDDSLESGNVLIQSNEGIFDAQLMTQLNKFRDVLSEELANGQLEIFS